MFPALIYSENLSSNNQARICGYKQAYKTPYKENMKILNGTILNYNKSQNYK